MPSDPLEQVLRLVAEGRLTADEAAPLLAALDNRAAGSAGGQRGGDAFDASPDAEGDAFAQTGGAGSLRIEIRDHGRKVVNLRLPVAVARFALDRVPGLSVDDAARVREALESGMEGAILDIDDGGDDGVRIVLERSRSPVDGGRRTT